MALDTSSQMDELGNELQMVKCVVVGDTGVGKTRLICARACGTKYPLSQLMQTHVPTVWAIDQYRKNQQVLNRSWSVVDGVNVSLRLWDTFGDHDKDRRFAYGRADVVVVCFSVVSPRSLRNVRSHWYPEIQRLCPGVPIVLCGCQVDLRYLYKDPHFIDLDKGPFFREIYESDVLYPESGRSMAKQLGAYYYEASVLEHFGIDEIFLNVSRAALISKRDRHFWTALGSLKRISRPVYQVPHLAPKPPAPHVKVPPVSSITSDLELVRLLESEACCDVVFEMQGARIFAHRVCLLIASPVFEEVFRTSTSLDTPKHSSDLDDAMPSSPYHDESNLSPDVTADTAKLIENDQNSLNSADNPTRDGLSSSRPFANHPVFASIDWCNVEDRNDSVSTQTVIAVRSGVSPAIFRVVLHYLYTGRYPVGGAASNANILVEVRRLADAMGLADLAFVITNILNNEDYMNLDVYAKFQAQRNHRIGDLVLNKGVFSDVLFKLDDKVVRAHRALLMAHCDVMASMFTNNFMERSAKLVRFPGVCHDTFNALLEYLYTGACPNMTNLNCLELIELANRLCQSRLLVLVEQFVVCELSSANELGQDITEEVLALLESAQLHNANQLASWCLWYLAVNYQCVYKRYSKVLHTLRPENQIYLTVHRHPPLWYLKEHDLYEKSVVDMQREKTVHSCIPRNSSTDISTGCLWFCARRNKKALKFPNTSVGI